MNYKNKVLKLFKEKKYQELLVLIEKVIEKDYYWFLMIKIKTLLVMQKYNLALKLVKQELEMPYIPKPYDQELKKWELKIKIKLEENQETKVLSPDEIIKKINTLDNEKDLIALLPLLKNINLRILIKEIKTLFLKKGLKNFKILLFILLKEQNINEKFLVILNNQKNAINVKDLKLPNKHPFYNEVKKLIEPAFFKKTSQKRVLKQLIDEYFWKEVFLQETYEDVKKVILNLHIEVHELFGENYNLDDIKTLYK